MRPFLYIILTLGSFSTFAMEGYQQKKEQHAQKIQQFLRLYLGDQEGVQKYVNGSWREFYENNPDPNHSNVYLMENQNYAKNGDLLSDADLKAKEETDESLDFFAEKEKKKSLYKQIADDNGRSANEYLAGLYTANWEHFYKKFSEIATELGFLPLPEGARYSLEGEIIKKEQK